MAKLKNTALPTYTELATALVALIEHSIANIDSRENCFVSCYTYPVEELRNRSQAVGVYVRAMDLRNALKSQKVV